jgi:hypothetical protein
MTKLTAERLILPQWQENDRPLFVDMNNDPMVMQRLGMTANPADDYDYPNLTLEHPFSRHVLYRLINHQKQKPHHRLPTV